MNDPAHGHRGFIGGFVFCPTQEKRVEMHEAYAGFFICPGCGQRIEGMKWT